MGVYLPKERRRAARQRMVQRRVRRQRRAASGEVLRAAKVVAFKMKRRKGYHKKIGHRQNLLKVKVTAVA